MSLTYDFSGRNLRVDNSVVVGDDNIITGNNNSIKGNRCKVLGNDNIILGDDTIITGNNNKVTGKGTKATGENNFETSPDGNSQRRLVRSISEAIRPCTSARHSPARREPNNQAGLQIHMSE